jgi:aryl-alcohol dehydrogenase-like predicted oxidoreductase
MQILLAMTMAASSEAMTMAAPRSSELAARLQGAPRLGLGMAALGRPGYINLGHDQDLPAKDVEAMRVQAHEVLDEAYRLGLRYIDCARSYGLSEEFVASWLAKQTADVAAAMVCGSKWGYEYTAAWRIQVEDGEAHEVKKHTVEQHERQLGETRSILGDKLHLYQIHSATEASGVLEAPDVLAVLGKLRDQGVAVGASVSHPQAKPLELAAAATSPGDGKPLFASVQATYNLLDQSAGPFLEAAAAQGVFVIVKEGVANGRLTARNVGSDTLAVLEAEAAKLSTTVDALALAWILTQPFVGMVLSGASTCEQLRQNCDALRLAPLDPALHERLSRALGQDCEQYWQDRRNLSWN